jgi:hypothetical protein
VSIFAGRNARAPGDRRRRADGRRRRSRERRAGGAQRLRQRHVDDRSGATGWTPPWLEILHDQANDVRYAIRGLAKNPVFSLTVVGVLTLGIGLNAAVFTLLKSVAISPLAGVAGSGRLRVIVGEPSTGRQADQRATASVGGRASLPIEAAPTRRPPSPRNRSSSLPTSGRPISRPWWDPGCTCSPASCRSAPRPRPSFPSAAPSAWPGRR